MFEATTLYTKEALKEVESVWHNESILTVGAGVLDCPNRTAAGASPRPTMRGHLYVT